MAVKVLIIPDKFKGTLSAAAAAAAIARGWRNSRPQDALELAPMSDGGDGFGEVIGDLLGAQKRITQAVDAAHRPCRVCWRWHAPTRTAVLESAAVIGLAMLPPGKFHPFVLDTFGLGELLRKVASSRPRRCLVGIGGSATNDGGFGLAGALGWEFFDDQGRRIKRWTDLCHLQVVRAPRKRRWFKKLVVAVDVGNPLLGKYGATRVYGPQKGLAPANFAQAEACLTRLARFAEHVSRRKLVRVPGAGAAGGLGFGLMAFAGARLEPGFELFARLAKLPQRLRSADLVITGEGTIDASTFMGKGIGQVAKACRQLGIPCIGLAGTSRPGVNTARLFTAIHALTDKTTLKDAKARPAYWLEHLAREIAAVFFSIS